MKKDVNNIEELLDFCVEQMTYLAGAISILAANAVYRGWFPSVEEFEKQTEEAQADIQRRTKDL